MMTLTAKQFHYLSAMGITVWQQRHDTDKNPENNLLPVEQTELVNCQLFKDILLSVNLDVADVIFTDESIKLVGFNWHFVNSDTIVRENQHLFTPPLAKIAQDSALKRRLWQELAYHA